MPTREEEQWKKEKEEFQKREQEQRKKEQEQWRKEQKARQKRDEEQRKKEEEEAQKRKRIEYESHSEKYHLICSRDLKLIEVMPGGALNTSVIKLLLGQAFDKIRDLEVEIKELKTQLGLDREVVKQLEIKVNHKEIDSLIETIEKTPG